MQIFNINNIDITNDFNNKIFLGESYFNLRNLISSSNQILEIDLKNPKNQKNQKDENIGQVNIRAKEREDSYEYISVKFGLKEMISKNPIALKLSTKNHTSDWIPIFFSNQIQQKGKITYWETTQISMTNLKTNKGDTKIKFEVIEFIKGGKVKILGELKMNAKVFKLAPAETEINLTRRFKNYLLISDFKVQKIFKFFDYLISELNVKLFLFQDVSCSNINMENFNYLIKKNSKRKKKDIKISNISKEDLRSSIGNDNDTKSNLKNSTKKLKLFDMDEKEQIKKEDNHNDKDKENDNENDKVINSKMKKKKTYLNFLTDFVDRIKVKNKNNPNKIYSNNNFKTEEQILDFNLYLENKKNGLDDNNNNNDNNDNNNNKINKNKLPESIQNMQILNDAIISFFVNFDSSEKFSMFCFGGKMKNSISTNNCFSANFDMLNPIVENYIVGNI